LFREDEYIVFFSATAVPPTPVSTPIRTFPTLPRQVYLTNATGTCFAQLTCSSRCGITGLTENAGPENE